VGCRKATRKVVKVTRFPPQFYAGWRARLLQSIALHESPQGLPSERFLQTLWQHQRLQRETLTSLDGRSVRILHPGFWNHEAGPDFHDALIQFDQDFPSTGDVEIDLLPTGWHSHGHDRNPAFSRVILHVVWDAALPAPATPPTLALKNCLDSPLDELRHWLGVDASLPEHLAGRCLPPLRALPDAEVAELLRQAAEVRLRRKGQELAARARETGWEQALREGLFGGLGYKHNVWPMRRLAELLPHLLEAQATPTSFELQTRLLGVGGLLPHDMTGARLASDRYLRDAWDLWWRDKAALDAITLPPGIWRFHGSRPANHPQRRLALATQWLVNGDLARNLETWLARDLSDRELPWALFELLRGQADAFWSWHWNLRAPRLAEPQPLLGPQRATDLAVNVVLPWLWMRAVVGQNEHLRSVAEHRYFTWPAAGDNAVLRLARQRMLGAGRRHLFRRAAPQQGLLQIERDFCEQSNALCHHCPMPEWLDALGCAATQVDSRDT
jgi:hypothetical protein